MLGREFQSALDLLDGVTQRRSLSGPDAARPVGSDAEQRELLQLQLVLGKCLSLSELMKLLSV